MKIKRYFAEDMRRALAKVREAQGADAVILSSRKIDGGVEVVAAMDYDEELISPPRQTAPAALDEGRVAGEVGARGATPNVDGNFWTQEPAMVAMRDELQSIRGLLESQLSGLAWGDLGRRQPHRAALLRKLLQMELDPGLAREIAGEVQEQGRPDAIWRRALGLLARRLPVSNDNLMERGGVVAMVGPTGVGKTTTVAKLAARFALRHSPEDVALVTTDCYRVGAVEQLKTYGRIMGITVRATKDQEELRSALEELYDRRLVLIDTAGMSQRDLRLSKHLQMIHGGSPMVKIHLVLSATTQAQGLNEIVNAFGDVDLEGCTVTKLDEATLLGSVISVAIMNQLPIAYVSSGQRVPEDIDPARAHNLISKAVSTMQKHNEGCADESMELAYGAMAADGRV